MEQDFLQALSSYYFDGKPAISDEEFENLKDELLWNGSKVAVLDKDELMFLEATQAYTKGQPIMADDDYNALKAELKQKASVVAAEGPRCSLRSKKMYADCSPDYLRMLALNVPAALLVLGVVFAIDDITGFEITKAIQLPPPYGVALLWGLLLPTTFVLASSITNILFKDSVVLKGPCPNCGAENFTYFGEVLSVAGNRGQNAVDCVSCGAGLTFDETKRIIVVSETAEEKEKKRAELAAKKAASAAKKKAKVAANAE
uniref:PGR5-like protein 1A, chloroplastic n=1 Tax=Chlamydomonas leiostraca TaxID=1034604 RepID=A0A7S0N9T8_9CHLO|mmetsp:Transcript_11585/g.28377  ORF Transcript_11585/g.28377 Transcript_11585/m.28377 type:complete len:259 (+) Transcript_11585:1064-1840(+)